MCQEVYVRYLVCVCVCVCVCVWVGWAAVLRLLSEAPARWVQLGVGRWETDMEGCMCVGGRGSTVCVCVCVCVLDGAESGGGG